MSSTDRILIFLAAGLLTGWSPARGQPPATEAMTVPAPTLAGSADDPTQPGNWRNSQRCGINSAYVLLGLRGIKVDYDQLLRRIGVGERGSTLKDLRDATADAGLPSVVAKTTLEGLSRSPLPVVAHMERQDSAEFARDRRGHYVVVVSVSDRTVRYVDGTTGSMTSAPRLDFARQWTGYVLAPSVRSSRTWYRPGWLGVAVVGLFSAVSWGGLFLSRRTSAARDAIAALALIATAAGHAAAGDPPRTRPVPTVAEVRAEIDAQRTRTPALWIIYETKQTALDEPATLAKYLNKLFLRNDRSEDAFKGPKRLHKVKQPGEVDPIAPPAPPVVDPDAPAAIRENQERVREHFEENAAKATKSAAPAGLRKLSFQPEEAWAYNGNGLDLRRLVLGLAEVQDYRNTGSMMTFQSGYFHSVGWEPDDPTIPKEKKAVRVAMTLPGALDAFRYDTRSALESAEDGSACVVLSGQRKQGGLEIRSTIWLDVDHGLMIRRNEQSTGDGTVGYRIVADDPRPVPGSSGIFLPGRCRLFEFAPYYAPGNLKGKALAQTEMTLLDCKANDLVPDSIFELTPPPGTLVNDYRKGADIGLKTGYPLEFVVPADASELDRVIDEARREVTARQVQSSGSRLFVLLNVVGVAVLVLVVAGRRFFRQPTRPIEDTNP